MAEDIYVDEFNRNAVARLLNLDNLNDIKKNQDRIQRLIDWAQAKGAKDMQEILWNIKQLQNRSGSPSLGSDWPKHLSQIAYLEMERMKLDKDINDLTSTDGDKQEANTEGV